MSALIKDTATIISADQLDTGTTQTATVTSTVSPVDLSVVTGSSATTQIVGNSVEASNVDIATQFSHMIVAQQAYSASAKVMTTTNQMMQSLLAVVQ